MNAKIKKLPMWRIDNAYSFLITICSIVFTIIGLYFGVVTDIKMMRKDIDEMNVRLEKWDMVASEEINEFGVVKQRQMAVLTVIEDKFGITIK